VLVTEVLLGLARCPEKETTLVQINHRSLDIDYVIYALFTIPNIFLSFSMTRAKKNPFSKPYKERAPGIQHGGLGKNNKVPIPDRQRAIKNGTIEDFREKERSYKKTSRQKLREQAILNDKLFKMAQAKLEEENLLIPIHVAQETMLQYLDVNCKMKVTPSTVNENPEMIERMYRQAVALKQSMKGQRKATYVKELTKQLRYMLNKVDDGRAFQVLENFFKSKIQELFSAADIVDLQQQHEGSAMSMKAIEQIGGLGRRDLFNDDKTPKRFMRGLIPSRSTIQLAQRNIAISVERQLQMNDMVSAVYSEDGQSVVLNIDAVIVALIERRWWISRFGLRLSRRQRVWSDGGKKGYRVGVCGGWWSHD